MEQPTCMWKGCRQGATVLVDDDLFLCDKHYARASLLEDFESGFAFGMLAGMAANLPGWGRRRNR